MQEAAVTLDRARRVIRLDFTVFREIEFDYEATTQAASIVTLTSAASAIVAAIATGRFFFTLLGVFIAGIAHWVVWGFLSAVLARELYHARIDADNTLRVLGYALVTRALSVLTIIPGIGWIGSLVGEILALLFGVKGVDDAFDLGAVQAAFITLVSWIAATLVAALIGFIFRGGVYIFNHLWT